jgi:hypothetical protein
LKYLFNFCYDHKIKWHFFEKGKPGEILGRKAMDPKWAARQPEIASYPVRFFKPVSFFYRDRLF